MDTKKLRQKILDLAIRGKLVPQDPNDEPASVLLERIRAEKEQLIKDGKIKRAKKSAASDKSHYENMPYKIPSNWCWTTIGELFYLQAGKFINASEITDCKDDLHSYPCYGGNGLRGYVTTYNRNGLFPIIGRQGALCGNINVAEGKFYATEHAVVVETFASVDVKVFVYFLIQLNLNQYATATAQPGLAVKTINEVPIPLPPLNEQYRISHAIEKAFNKMSIIDESKYSLCMCIQQFKAGVLDIAISGKLVPQDSSDEPAIELLKRINPDFVSCDNRHYENIQINIPDTWCWGKVGDLFEHNTGKALNSSNMNGSMLNYITTSNLYWDRFDLTVVKQMRFTDSEIEKCKATKGDLLLCEGGDVGRAAIWNYDFDIMIQNHIHRLRGKADVSSRFFFYVFMLYKQKNYIGGKGVAIQGLSSRDLHNLPIPVPPLKEQYRIADTLDNLIAKMDKITAEL